MTTEVEFRSEVGAFNRMCAAEGVRLVVANVQPYLTGFRYDIIRNGIPFRQKCQYHKDFGTIDGLRHFLRDLLSMARSQPGWTE